MGPAASAGLVPYAITVREHEQTGDEIEPIWRPAFPTADLVHAAADLIPSIHDTGPDIAEGPRWELVVSPGVIRVRTRDWAKAECSAERAQKRDRMDADVLAGYVEEHGCFPDDVEGRGTILGWSRKSRARMIARLSDLDYTALYGVYRVCQNKDCKQAYEPELDRCPHCRCRRSTLIDRSNRLPAMLTLTYSGDWVRVVPDPKTAKDHFQALCKRYARAWGEPLVCTWKQEFQARGAPHFHLATTPPMGTIRIRHPLTGERIEVDFKRWLSITWADIVDHPDPEERRKHELAGTGVDYAQGIKLTDPRRMAVYFAKYGASGNKEYQHTVPQEWLQTHLECANCGRPFDDPYDGCPDCGGDQAELVTVIGAGRFWGYRGLTPVLAIRQVTPQVGIAAGRILRRWYRAKRLTKRVRVQRVEQSTGRVRYRTTTKRKQLFACNRGFVIVNDGPGMVSQLARPLAESAAGWLHPVTMTFTPR